MDTDTITITVKMIRKDTWNKAKGKAAIAGIKIQDMINRLLKDYLRPSVKP